MVIGRSRLAGEEAPEPCVGLEDAFAGKPAPTRDGGGWGYGAGRVAPCCSLALRIAVYSPGSTPLR
ncbi:hypothetical protein CEP86_32270 [Pseudomonas protegens]|nr:hypothetical protein CEP86_32270 [Pseudomonas protegens]